MEQFDIKTAFLHKNLEETIFMQQLEGYIEEGGANKVWLLRRLYMFPSHTERGVRHVLREERDFFSFFALRPELCVSCVYEADNLYLSPYPHLSYFPSISVFLNSFRIDFQNSVKFN